MKETKEKKFYGWVIAVCCFILMGTVFQIVGNMSNLFIKPLSESLGVPRGAVSVFVTISMLVSVIGSSFVGKLIQKYSLRLVTTVGVLCAGGGLIAMSFAKNLTQVYLISIFLGIGIICSAMIPINMMLNNWFVKKRGTVIGIVYTSTGFGGLLFTQVITYFLSNYSYREAYLALGIIVLVLTLPVTLFLIRLTPEEKGQKAYGADEVAATATSNAGGNVDGFLLKDLKKSKSFILFLITNFILGLVGVGLFNQFFAHLSDRGFTAAEVGIMSSIINVGLILSKPVLGGLMDKFGGLFTFIFSCCLYVVAILLLGASFAGSMIMPILAVIVLPFAASITSTGPSFITGEFYGRKDYGAIYGIVLMVYNLGAAAGPALAGASYDMTGSYVAIGIVYMILVAVMIGLMTLTKKSTKALHQ